MAAKKQLERCVNLNHQQWGWAVGMLLGFALGVYVVAKFQLKSINWVIEGTVHSDDETFNLVVEACIIPLSSGLFANLFSNLGAGIDVITDKNTLLSWAYSVYMTPRRENESSFELSSDTTASAHPGANVPYTQLGSGS